MSGLGRHIPARFFCAVCARDLDLAAGETPRQAPLGTLGAMVNVCDRCLGDGPDPRMQRDLPPAYDCPDPDELDAAARRTIAKLSRRVNATLGITNLHRRAHREFHNETCREVTPGWIIVRVAKRDANGRSRDMVEATKTLAGKPWIDVLRYLGCDVRWVLFERPPTTKSGNYLPSDNPLAAIEVYRVTGERTTP